MNLTFSANIEAADAGRRIISGKIAPFGEVGNTSVGAVIFERGSIKVPSVSKVKLLAQHEQTAHGVIGRAQSINEDANGMYATFKVSASRDGENMLIKCAEGLLDGLSVGVDVISSKEAKDGTLIVTAAILKEVSVVESPAFDSARIVDVAAQEAEDVIEQIEDEQIQKISEAVAILEEVQKVEKALEDTEETETTNESEATVENTAKAPEVEAAAEASPTIKASVPYGDGVTRVRHGINSFSKYVEHKVKAAAGSEESRLWVAASEDPTALTAADTMSTNPAFNPIQYLSTFVSNTNFGRPAIDAVSKGTLPSAGMTINIPTLVTSAGGGTSVAPTVAETAENVAPSSTAMTSAYESVAVKKFAGQQVVTLELLERSDPIFFDQLAIQLQRAYLLATDNYLISVLSAEGTQATGVAGTSAGMISFIGTEAAEAYKGSSYFANNLVTNTSWWSTLMSAVDTTGRPIYNASQPWNAAGQAAPGSIKGNVLGLDLYVDKNVTTGLVDESAFIIAPETVTYWESPTAFFSVNHVADATGNMAIQTAIYGYGAAKVMIPAGVRRFNLA